MKAPTNGFTVDSHFENKDAALRKIEGLLKSAKKFGPVNEEPKKTSIHLMNRTALAGVATCKSVLVLTIKSDRKLLKSAHSQIRADVCKSVSSRSETGFTG